MASPDSILEASLYVTDVNRAVAFYRDTLGLRLMDKFEEGRGAAFQVGSMVLLLFRAEETLQGGDLPAHGAYGAGHIAFRVEPAELPHWRERLNLLGIPIEREHAFSSNPPSIYFRDPDGNLLELAVSSIWPLQDNKSQE